MRGGGLIVVTLAVAGGVSAQQRWLAPTERLTATGAITEFALPHPASGPTTIALAPDGTLWFTESDGNRIGRMNPDGTGLVEFDVPTEESAPRIIALGADGNLWFSEHLASRIARITPQGEIAEFRIPTPDSQPRAIALGADGNIWFGLFAAGKIGRVTPAGVITEFEIPTPFSGPRALAAGPDGNIWFSEFHASKIGRITMDGVVTEFALPRPDSGPGDITAGADGNLWFVELNGTIDGRFVTGNRVGRITPRGEITEFAIPSPTGSPTNVAVGPDRNVWYTKGAALGRVTPRWRDHRVSARRQRTRRRSHRRQRSSAAATARESALVRGRQRQQDQLPPLRMSRAIGNITPFQLACRVFVPPSGTGDSHALHHLESSVARACRLLAA